MEVFFDSNVFLHHLADSREEATNLIEKVELGDITGYINDIVISEVTYGYIRAITGLSPFNLKKKIEKIEIDLSPLKELFDLFEVLPCRFGNITLDIMEKYNLLPNDALIVATCRYYGIRKIATFDKDFKRVDFLEIVLEDANSFQ